MTNRSKVFAVIGLVISLFLIYFLQKDWSAPPLVKDWALLLLLETAIQGLFTLSKK